MGASHPPFFPPITHPLSSPRPSPLLSSTAESDDELRITPQRSGAFVEVPGSSSDTTLRGEPPALGGPTQQHLPPSGATGVGGLTGIELQTTKLPPTAAAAAVGELPAQAKAAAGKASGRIKAAGSAGRGPPQWLRSLGTCWGGDGSGCDAQRTLPLQSTSAAEKARSPQGPYSSALMEGLLGTTTHVIHCAAR